MDFWPDKLMMTKAVLNMILVYQFCLGYTQFPTMKCKLIFLFFKDACEVDGKVKNKPLYYLHICNTTILLVSVTEKTVVRVKIEEYLACRERMP